MHKKGSSLFYELLEGRWLHGIFFFLCIHFDSLNCVRIYKSLHETAYLSYNDRHGRPVLCLSFICSLCDDTNNYRLLETRSASQLVTQNQLRSLPPLVEDWFGRFWHFSNKIIHESKKIVQIISKFLPWQTCLDKLIAMVSACISNSPFYPKSPV